MTLHDLYGVPYVSEFFNVLHSLLGIGNVYGRFILIVLVGMLVGRGVYLALSRLLRLIKFDRLVGRVETQDVFAPSMAVARFGYFFVVLLFFLVGIEPITTQSIKSIITDVYLLMANALSLVGLWTLAVFVAHYGGSLIRYVVNLSGYKVGEPLYVVFCSLVLIGGLRSGLNGFLELNPMFLQVLSIGFVVVVPPLVVMRKGLSKWLRGDCSLAGLIHYSE